ncbi:MAG TPA: amylo-alpha-1,6-glucosidase [Candidatus Eisenbacteria bacterium]|nr:amylo-alpha-1,6-glucosidase [Candidatus Eisenbacteria bacterium]
MASQARMALPGNGGAEWLETDGLGGFASGTTSGIRTRRYHALLLPATTPPAGRVVMVNGLEVWVETAAGTFALSSQHYTPDVTWPDGASRIVDFATDPWPRWTYTLGDGLRIEQECFVRQGAPMTVLAWRALGAAGPVRLHVRPLVSGRDYHALHHENPAFRFDAETGPGRVVFRPYRGLPPVVAISSGTYTHEPTWYRNFLYDEEAARGLDCVEDLASPGTLSFDLAAGEATLVLTTDPGATVDVATLRSAERRRRAAFPSRLHRAADAYVVTRGHGKTIVAGYPWFTDWGRDTFIALRGLCLATGRIDDARSILVEWAGHVSDGMLPNRFPDHGEVPEYNSVDAALWYVVAVHDLFDAARRAGKKISKGDRATLEGAIDAILAGYARGTRHGIRVDGDGLLAAGVPGLQLTWMDAKVGDWVVTPRIGKPVEVQALWLNALRIGAARSERWAELHARGKTSFEARFWNEILGCLHDVVDPDHVPGTVNGGFRPNQILAVGGLPFPIVEGERARRVVDSVETRLWASIGLRSLAPGSAAYAPHYEGGVRERDGAYHQGTIWPWLLGAFVDAWVRVRGGTREAKAQARARFLMPVLAHLDEAGLGHVSEIVDAEPPHTPRGCPFQAWSVGEAIRIAHVFLGE